MQHDRMLTYTYPRTLAEAMSRHACSGEDAQAIHGPYKSAMATDDVVTMFALIGIAIAVVFQFAGWIQ